MYTRERKNSSQECYERKRDSGTEWSETSWDPSQQDVWLKKDNGCCAIAFFSRQKLMTKRRRWWSCQGEINESAREKKETNDISLQRSLDEISISKCWNWSKFHFIRYHSKETTLRINIFSAKKKKLRNVYLAIYYFKSWSRRNEKNSCLKEILK